MEHPHVARVHDAGLTPSGRPYFVMEHVKGVPITEYCDKHRLTVEERLRLFLHVCEAVQHAHQKGVIHRDLKPSNILVAIEDKEAVPKVIDFGVARAMGTPLTERTLHTEQGQLVGTPEYMSPEQADLSNQDIDTRTDVYSLGVVLFELIAGILPFDPHTLREHGIEGARKVICEEDPQTPSTKLSRTSVEESTEAAQRRRTNPRQLQRTLQGDLDWITLKAMEKESRASLIRPQANSPPMYFGTLNHEPVTAGRPSPAYKARKFVRRHRALVIGLAAVLTVFVSGAIVSSRFAVRAKHASEVAATVAEFLQKHVFRAMDAAERGGRQVYIKEILDVASQEVSSQFGDSPLQEASIRKTLGTLYANADCFEDGQRNLMRSSGDFHTRAGPRGSAYRRDAGSVGASVLGTVAVSRGRRIPIGRSGGQNSSSWPRAPRHAEHQKMAGMDVLRAGICEGKRNSRWPKRTRVLGGVLKDDDPETVECMLFHGCALLQYVCPCRGRG